MSCISIGLAISICIQSMWAVEVSKCTYTITDMDNYECRTLDLSPLSRSLLKFVNGSITMAYSPCETAVQYPLDSISTTSALMVYVSGHDTYCKDGAIYKDGTISSPAIADCLPTFSSRKFPTYRPGPPSIWTFEYLKIKKVLNSYQIAFWYAYTTINWECNMDVTMFKTRSGQYNQFSNQTKQNGRTIYYYYMYLDWTIQSQYACPVSV
eukprot:85518_1